MPFKSNDQKTKKIASMGAKAKNIKYPEHYRKWLFKKGDPRTLEMSKKAVLARHEKHPDLKEFYGSWGKRSRRFENRIAEQIRNEYDKIFYVASVCDRIALRGDELIFIEIKQPRHALRPQQKEFVEAIKNVKNVRFEIRP
jgi:hypothetical protein